MDFLLKCLNKFGPPAFVLFENVTIGNEYLQVLLSDEYSFIFNSSYAMKEILKSINEQLKQQQIKINEDKLKYKNELKKMEDIFSDQLQKMKEELITDYSQQLREKNDQILQLTQQIEISQFICRKNHKGILAKLGDSVEITSGPHTNQNGVKNLLKDDCESEFYNYYNEINKTNDGNLCNSIADSQIIFNFRDKKIDLFSYLIRSNKYHSSQKYYHPKTWKIEGSNDKINWNMLDRRVDDSNLNGTYKEYHFKCQQSKYGCQENRYKYIKFTQEDSWGNNKFNIYITFFELYGDDY